MAAITRPHTAEALAPLRFPPAALPQRPSLRLLPGGVEHTGSSARLHPAVYRRRRVVALVVLLLAVASLSALGSHLAVLDVGAAPATAAGTGPVVTPDRYVVQPGDSLWSIAATIQPDGDLRPLVHDLARVNGGTTIRPGDVLVVP